MSERIGIIGGSGLGNALAAAGGGDAVVMETPFGAPSGPLMLAEWAAASKQRLAQANSRLAPTALS